MNVIQKVCYSFILANLLADLAHQTHVASQHSDGLRVRSVQYHKTPALQEQTRRTAHEMVVLRRLARFLLGLNPVAAFIAPCCPMPTLFCSGSASSSRLDSFMFLQDPLVLCHKHDEAQAEKDWTTANAIQEEFLSAGYHMFFHENGTTGVTLKPTGPRLIELSHSARLNSSTEAEVAAAADAALHRVKTFLQLPRCQRDCNGRACADAAFWFALAGAHDEALFELLADVTHQELLRLQNKDIFQFVLVAALMLERHAAAGTRPSHPMFDVGKSYLQEASWETNRLHRADARPLRQLWLHQRMRSRSHERPLVGAPILADFLAPDAPIMIDIGCGTGAMCLGYAEKRLDTNVLGVDTDNALLRYPRGIARRSGLSDRAQFVWGYGIDAVRWVRQNYSGELSWITLNFPTPYVSPNGNHADNGNNVWLPRSPDAENFLGNSALISEISLALQERGGRLLLQSINEDVVVHLRTSAEKHGLEAVSGSSLGVSEVFVEQSVSEMTLRNQRYDGPRAVGPGWLSSNPLGVMAETEAGYQIDGKPVHRCVLEWKH